LAFSHQLSAFGKNKKLTACNEGAAPVAVVQALMAYSCNRS
jgi:hypothetical protein